MNQSNFEIHKKVVIRTPVNSYQKKIDNDLFMESLYLASPSFYYELIKNRDKNKSTTPESKIDSTLYKYDVRASNRCTPFGLFAAISIGGWGDKTEVLFDTDKKKVLKRKTRLDMNVLCLITLEISKQDFMRPHLKYYPNSSLYQVGNKYRYVEYFYRNGQRLHNITTVQRSEYLEKIIEKCSFGLTWNQISDILVNNEISQQEANDFIKEVVDSQVLVSDLEPNVTGEEYFDIIHKYLNKVSSIDNNEDLASLTKLINGIYQDIKDLDTEIINPIISYENIYNKLKILLPELTETNLLQTDLYKNVVFASINKEIEEKIKKALKLLQRFGRIYSPSKLEDFKNRFYERYNEEEVPLLIALDKECGIGYPDKDYNGINELVDDLNFDTPKDQTSNVESTNLDFKLHRILTDALIEKKTIVEISTEDFKDIESFNIVLPQSFSVTFKILDTETNKIAITSVGCNSAVNLLARFNHKDPELTDLLQDITNYEQQLFKGKILAEIAHLPEDHIGNIVTRPILRKFEIPYLAKSYVESDNIILAKDLYVRVVNDQVVLFDKRLMREIVPKLGNAHNYTYNTLPIYNFLCDLQTQYFSGEFIQFNWGSRSSRYSFLPRIEYDGIILNPAMWNVEKDELEVFKVDFASTNDKCKIFSNFKSRLNLPEKFVLAEGDKELLIDCNSEIAMITFFDIASKRDNLSINEFYFNDKDGGIRDLENNYFTNEIIATIFNKSIVESNTPEEYINITNKTIRTFNPGSEWLYYKIYCGRRSADFILINNIKAITDRFIDLGFIDKWFFIRYSDPEPHLRLRFHIKNIELLGDIIKEFKASMERLQEDHLVSKISIETYVREIERYGENIIEYVEDLFFNDSVFTIDVLTEMSDSNSGKMRWYTALLSVDNYLNDFGYFTEDKLNLIDNLKNTFFSEFVKGKSLKISLDKKYRNYSLEIEKIMGDKEKSHLTPQGILFFLQKRSKRNFLAVNKIVKPQTDDIRNVKLNRLLSSVLHMSLNRLFMGRNRHNEFVIYYFLSKYYKSQIASKKVRPLKDNSSFNTY